MQDKLCFRLNDENIQLAAFNPTATLLDFVREQKQLKGTKEGCNEGDCGACTLALGSVEQGKLVYRPVNACIQLLGMVHGKHVVTVDHLSDGNGNLHPVQASMVKHHGSQCGFCTPGIVMSLYCLNLDKTDPPTRETVNTWLAGNLCRCTGYRPIVDAAMESCFSDEEPSQTAQIISEITTVKSLFVGDANSFFAAPVTLEDALKLYTDHPDATLVAGATDVGLWINKRLEKLPKILHLGRIQSFSNISEGNENITINAGATYESALSVMSTLDPDISALILRIGSRQVRASGTIGGNIANGSPIGDTPPVLIALNATLELKNSTASRTIPLEDFFIEYGKQDRKTDELVTAINVPKLRSNERFRCTKISKRFDQDISAVMAAFKITLDGDKISAARIAYGGMAGIPKRAGRAEAELVGASLQDECTWDAAIAAIAEDFAPMSDMRASAEYRQTVGQNTLRKALVEIAGADSVTTRVTAPRDDGLEAVI
ncbi:MAG: xanthine dehydrogenase small subunit [Hyphomicrobiales bacterium]